ncbi:hypothetical protein [Rubellicoccus peritrichatus]|uniref:EVE domain-containing protein n=1 Tax=Rubellicoccus peritrichatus TaxID=3080537 RepID=A0AAQ3LBW4_9BACT|nr:hypothetical protein [Puniceicoccus sp. CR14]WOO42447.1 hypothetical protein RZN69_05045 [Puniceicoccus sp. CR14]
MNHWLYPANTKFYDVFGALKEPETYWPMNSKVAVGDRLFIYLAAPYKQVGFLCDVVAIDFALSEILEKVRPFIKGEPDGGKSTKPFMKIKCSLAIEIEDDSPFAYSHLVDHGLKGMLMGPRKLENNIELLSYLKEAENGLR